MFSMHITSFVFLPEKHVHTTVILMSGWQCILTLNVYTLHTESAEHKIVAAVIAIGCQGVQGQKHSSGPSQVHGQVHHQQRNSPMLRFVLPASIKSQAYGGRLMLNLVGHIEARQPIAGSCREQPCQ
jgi:hypothetical protein